MFYSWIVHLLGGRGPCAPWTTDCQAACCMGRTSQGRPSWGPPCHAGSWLSSPCCMQPSSAPTDTRSLGSHAPLLSTCQTWLCSCCAQSANSKDCSLALFPGAGQEVEAGRSRWSPEPPIAIAARAMGGVMARQEPVGCKLAPSRPHEACGQPAGQPCLTGTKACNASSISRKHRRKKLCEIPWRPESCK